MKKIRKNNRLAAGALTQAAICAASILLAAPFGLHAGDARTLSPAEKNPVIEKKETNPLSLLDGKVVFDVEERLRYEFRDNNFDFNSGVNAPTDASFLLQRARIGLKLSPLPWLRAYGQLQSSIEVGDRGDEPGVFGAEGDDYIDLYQAWIEAANYKDWARELANWLYANEKVELFRSPSLQETSAPGESERDFRVRLQQRAREERDREVARLRQRYAPRLASLEERLRRARQALAREQEQARSQQLQTAVSIGSTLLGALFGRKLMSSANVGRAGTAVRSMSRARKEAGDVQRAGETIEALEQQLAELQAEIEAETGRLTAALDPMAEPFESLVIRPKKTGIQVRFTGLVWAPRT